MTEKTIITTGVVAEYQGKYWGIAYQDGHSTSHEFGEIEKAIISDPQYCRKPTDMTYNPANTGGYNPDFNKLQNATLVAVTKTVTFIVSP